MPDNSAILALPYIQPSQAQKHVTHNEAISALDVLVQLSVARFDATTPPVSTTEGETHALGAGPTNTPTGAWAGQDNTLATWRDGVWVFIRPLAGWRAWGVSEGELRIWDGTTWGLPVAGTNNLTGVGINTMSDATNRLSVSADATLLSHDGTGHQLKINKATGGDTASLLFQSGWTGHAEMGLSGNTKFAIKVSDDGSVWTEALHIDSNGNVGIGTTIPGARLNAETGAGVCFDAINSNESAGSAVMRSLCNRPANAAYAFFHGFSDANGTADLEFSLAGDGNGYCDGAWAGGGADYAEYFEWLDGNPNGEDRRGMSVVLVGDKIREAQAGEDPIGVISSNPSVVGDAAPFRWMGKYQRDVFGSVVMEEYEAVSWSETVTETDGEGKIVTREVDHSYVADDLPEGVTAPENAACVTQTRRKLSPGYDPAHAYIPRAERREWDTVGLMGKLRIHKGQVIGAGWVRMRNVSDSVEEWLVR